MPSVQKAFERAWDALAVLGEAIAKEHPPLLPLHQPAVILRGRGIAPIVNGVEKPILSSSAYRVVSALVDAGEEGLTTTPLAIKSGVRCPAKVLRSLARDKDWAAAIDFPGRPWVAYRLRKVALACSSSSTHRSKHSA